MPRRKSQLKVVDCPVDAETRSRDDDHVSVRLWLRLLSCTNWVGAIVRQRTQANFQMTLPRFDLMAQLERSEEGLKMSELSQRMMVTSGNVTGIADILEREGLVVRAVDQNDRRVYRVKLTAEGKRQFRRMADEHEQWIVELFAGLGTRQKHQLAKLLAQLKSCVSQRAQELAEGPYADV
jgi:DNA-binding MarR family transcriptional regulator